MRAAQKYCADVSKQRAADESLAHNLRCAQMQMAEQGELAKNEFSMMINSEQQQLTKLHHAEHAARDMIGEVMVQNTELRSETEQKEKEFQQYAEWEEEEEEYGTVPIVNVTTQSPGPSMQAPQGKGAENAMGAKDDGTLPGTGSSSSNSLNGGKKTWGQG